MNNKDAVYPTNLRGLDIVIHVAVSINVFPEFCKNYCCKTKEVTFMKKYQMKAFWGNKTYGV